jgi:phage-related protein
VTKLAELLIEVDIDADGVGIGIRRAADDVDDGFDRMENRASRAGRGIFKAFGKEMAVTGKPLAVLIGTGFSAQLLGTIGSSLVSGTGKLLHGFGASLALLPAAALAGGLALGALKLSLVGVGDALKAGMAGDAEKFNEALEGMAPAAQKVIREVVGLKGELDSLKNTVQGRFFAPLVGQVRPLAEAYLPLLSTHLGAVAQHMGRAANMAGGFLKIPAIADKLGVAMGHAATSVGDVTSALAFLPQILVPLVAVGATFLPQLTGGLEGAAMRLASFMREAERTGRLREFIQGGIDSIRELIDTAKQWGRIFANLGAVGAAVFGGIDRPASGLLDTIEKLSAKARRFAESAQGGEVFGQVMEAAGAVVDSFLGTLQRLLGMLGRVFGPIMPQVLEFIEALADLKSAVLDTGFDALEPVLMALGAVLGGVVLPALTSLAQFLTNNRPVLQGIGIAIMTLMVPAFVAWAVSAGAAAIATLLLWAPIILIGLAIAALAALVITHFDKIKGAISAVFNWVKQNWPLLLAILTGPFGLAVLAIARNWDSIKAGATAVKNWIVGRFNDVVSFVTGLPGRISSAASGMWDGIKIAFKAALNAIINWWNGLSFTLPTISIPGFDPPGPGPSFGGFDIGGQTFSTPNLPTLGEGGVIRSRPGGVPLIAAEAGMDEAVVPLPRGLRHMGEGGGGQVVNHWHVAGSIRSDRDLIRLFRDELDRGGLEGVLA